VKPSSLGTLAPASAMLTAICGFLYAVSFVILKNQVLFSLFLMLGGVFTIVVFVELHQRMMGANAAVALLALLIGALGAAGAMAHGGYDLANALHPPQPSPALSDLPSAVDPRGLATFALAGLALLAWSSVLRAGFHGSGLAYLGFLSGALLLLIYLARLIVLDASSPVVLVPALLEGFIVSPIWYVWLGLRLAGVPSNPAP